MKLAIIVGTRPELIKLSSILKKLTQYFDITLIHTGQNYDVNLDEIFYFFKECGHKSNYKLKDLKDWLGY